MKIEMLMLRIRLEETLARHLYNPTLPPKCVSYALQSNFIQNRPPSNASKLVYTADSVRVFPQGLSHQTPQCLIQPQNGPDSRQNKKENRLKASSHPQHETNPQ